MSTLEVTCLRLKSNVAIDSKELRTTLSGIRSQLKTGSRFFYSPSDTSKLYIFGLWPSISAHREFLASPTASKILAPQESLADFSWSLHMPLDSMSDLPLEAPVVTLARIFPKDGCKEKVWELGEVNKERTLEHTKQYGGMTKAWRSDAPDGQDETVVFSGWESEQAWREFRKMEGEDPKNASFKDVVAKVEVDFLKDLEKE